MYIVQKQTKFYGGHWILLATLSLSLAACGGTNGRRDRNLLFDARYQQVPANAVAPFQPTRTNGNTFFPNQPVAGAQSGMQDLILAQQAGQLGQGGTNPGPWVRQPGQVSRSGAVTRGAAPAGHGDLGLNSQEIVEHELWEEFCYGMGTTEAVTLTKQESEENQSETDRARIASLLSDSSSRDGDHISDACEKYISGGDTPDWSELPNGWLVGARKLSEATLRGLVLERFSNWKNPTNEDLDAYNSIAKFLGKDEIDRHGNGIKGAFNKTKDWLGGAVSAVTSPFRKKHRAINQLLAAMIAIETLAPSSKPGSIDGADNPLHASLIRDIFVGRSYQGKDGRRVTVGGSKTGGIVMENPQVGASEKIIAEYDYIPNVTSIQAGNANPLFMDTSKQRTPVFKLSKLSGVKGTLPALKSSEAFIYVVEGWVKTSENFKVQIARLAGARPAGIFMVIIDGAIEAHTLALDEVPGPVRDVLKDIDQPEMGKISASADFHHVLLVMITKQVSDDDRKAPVAENVFVCQADNQHCRSNWYHMPSVYSTIEPQELVSGGFFEVVKTEPVLLSPKSDSASAAILREKSAEAEKASVEEGASGVELASLQDRLEGLDELDEANEHMLRVHEERLKSCEEVSSGEASEAEKKECERVVQAAEDFLATLESEGRA